MEIFPKDKIKNKLGLNWAKLRSRWNWAFCQTQLSPSPSWLRSIILTSAHPANHPEKYNFQPLT